MPAHPIPSDQSSRGLVLTADALALFDQTLRERWNASAWRQDSKSGKMTRPDKSRLLNLDVKTIDRIYRREPVIEATLRNAFAALNITLSFSPEQHCVSVSSSDRSSRSLPGSVPHPLTRCLGRENQGAEIAALLEVHRLVTLTGSGGVGKTRLALQVAEELQGRFDKQSLFGEGVWFVELADVESVDADIGARVWEAVAATLGVSEEPTRPLSQTLTRFLQDKRLLLVLDNCEHLMTDCAALVHSLLFHCPSLKILVTSREKLGLPGEHPFRVPSLALPDVDTLSEAEDSVSRLRAAASVQLFVERARVHRPDFTVTLQNASLVISICRCLDGIPLALELAAARMGTMELEVLARGLDDCFALLRFGNRAVPRHETLQAAMDWSYTRLEDCEQALLRRLSVFAGGWTSQAAQQICQRDESERTETESLNLLTLLADKSLVIYDALEAGGRYRLLETVRQYGRARLTESGESADIKTRHLNYFLALAEKREPTEHSAWLQRMEAEHDNLRAALAWSLLEPDFQDSLQFSSLRFCGVLGRFWHKKGLHYEGRNWCEQALKMSGNQQPTRERAQALQTVGGLAIVQGDVAAAQSVSEEARNIFQKLEDRSGLAFSLTNLGHIALQKGDPMTARKLYQESLSLREELNDQSGIASSCSDLASVALSQSDFATARHLHETSRDIREKLGDRTAVAYALNNLGNVSWEQGEFGVAQTFFEDSLVIMRQIEDKYSIAVLLGNLGLLAEAQNDAVTALPYLQDSLEMSREMGNQRHSASVLLGLGRLALKQDDIITAKQRFDEVLSILQEIKDQNAIAILLNNLAELAIKQEDYRGAWLRYEESMVLFQEIEDRRGIAYSFEGLATVASLNVQMKQASVLLGAAAALREEIGSPLQPNQIEAYNQVVESVRQFLGDAAFGLGWKRGYSTPFEETIDYIRRSTNA